MYNNNNYPSIDVIRSKMDQVMVVPELSLGQSISIINQKSCVTTTTTSGSLSSTDQSNDTTRSLKKRKSFNDHIMQSNNKHVVVRRSLDDVFISNGEFKRDVHRLPLDWEQCLDLKSGEIYFLNRKTTEKVCDRLAITNDHHHKHSENNPLLELELNISSSPTSSSTHSSNSSFKLPQKTKSLLNDHQHKPTINVVSESIRATNIPTASCVVGSDNNMVAMACSNCHLLIILSKTSPICPNCKYVHYLHPTNDQQDFKASSSSSPDRKMKHINTLTLFS